MLKTKNHKSRMMRGGTIIFENGIAVAPSGHNTPENQAQAAFWNNIVPPLFGGTTATDVYNAAKTAKAAGTMMGHHWGASKDADKGIAYLGSISSLTWLINQINDLGDNTANLQILQDFLASVNAQLASRQAAPWANQERYQGYIAAYQDLSDATTAKVADLQSQLDLAGKQADELNTTNHSQFPTLGGNTTGSSGSGGGGGASTTPALTLGAGGGTTSSSTLRHNAPAFVPSWGKYNNSSSKGGRRRRTKKRKRKKRKKLVIKEKLVVKEKLVIKEKNQGLEIKKQEKDKFIFNINLNMN